MNPLKIMQEIDQMYKDSQQKISGQYKQGQQSARQQSKAKQTQSVMDPLSMLKSMPDANKKN